VIRRRLSAPPERRIVRLPHTVGQARLVGRPAPGGMCCIWDTFTDDQCTYLGDHKPEIGGPWEAFGSPIYPSSLQICPGVSLPDTKQPRIYTWFGGMVFPGYAEESSVYCGGRVPCTPDVQVFGHFLTADVVFGDWMRSAIVARWSGSADPGYPWPANNMPAGIMLLARGVEGYVLVFVVEGAPHGQYTQVAQIRKYSVEIGLNSDVKLYMDVVGQEVRWRATVSNESIAGFGSSIYEESASGTHKLANTFAGNGVGFWMTGVQYLSDYLTEFRACPL
jgi:hypothetical protein